MVNSSTLQSCIPSVNAVHLSLFYSPSQVRRRGVWPSGSGEVVFSCPTVRKMRPVQLTEEGKVRRVRGIAYPLLNCMAV